MSLEYRRIFTAKDRQAWEFVREEIPEPDGTALMTNRMMAEALGLREDREGSRYYHRLEDFGLIVAKQVRDEVTHRMTRRVWRTGGDPPAFVERASMVVIREVGGEAQ